MRDLLTASPADRSTAARVVQRGLAAFLAVTVALGVIVALSGNLLPSGESGHAESDRLDSVVGYWLHWDVGWYGRISQEGYPQREVDNYNRGDESAAAFFPGYPAAVRVLTPVVGEVVLAEILVTLLAGAIGIVLFALWCRRHDGDRVVPWALGGMLLYPYAYYLVAAPYSDALFLAAAIGSFALAERDQPVLAGLVGVLATATRPVGIGVVLGLLVLVARRAEGPRRRDLWVALSALGMAGFMAFLWARFGSPFAFASAQRGWQSSEGVWRGVVKVDFFDHLLHDPRPLIGLRLGVQGILGVLFLAAVPAVWRRYGPAYGIYTLVVVGLPVVGSAAFESTGRHLLAAFPVFALLGSWLAAQERGRAVGVLVASALSLSVVASFYARGYFMS